MQTPTRPLGRSLRAPSWLALGLAGLAAAAVPATTVRAPAAPAASPAPLAAARIRVDRLTPVLDPKLEGGGLRAAVRLTGSTQDLAAVAEVRAGATTMATLWSGQLPADGSLVELAWDGRDTSGDFCPPGDYEFTVEAGSIGVTSRIAIVRLGVTEIDALDTTAGGDHWQMVYFKKQVYFGFFATPAIHEYRNVAHGAELSDLDLDDGEPRPVVAVNADTARAVMDGNQYHTDTYNYPLAYRRGVRPRFEFRLGDSATSSQGAAVGVGYPLAQGDLRCVVSSDEQRVAASAPIAPGGTFVVELPALPDLVLRVDLKLSLRFEFRAHGASLWQPLEGTTSVPLRIYTLLDDPQWGGAANGTQYSGPWVEVAEYYHQWNRHLRIRVDDAEDLTKLHVRGFFGQVPGIPTAIEDALYDAGPLGGDGGATHYFNSSSGDMRLSRLLGDLVFGRYINCTDNMGATTTMLSMMGVPNLQPLRLGGMQLKAIWGIGAPAYTTNLWGNGSHGFSYHHIVTDDGGVTVSDTCMQLDEDGDPNSTPGLRGWNDHRPWAGPGGYNDLSSYNNVSTTLESLPGVR